MIGLYVFLGLALVYLLIGLYFYNISLNAKTDKTAVMEGNRQANGFDEYVNEIGWFDSQGQEVFMTSARGDQVHGYKFINPESNKWVIAVHGYLLEARAMSLYAKNFYDLGYNVLVPDLVGHGKSQGNTISMGGYDSDDLVLWAENLAKDYPGCQIVLFGMSMGAATVLNSLGKGLPENVIGFIEDSGYINLLDMFAYQLKKLYGLPKFLVLPAASLVTKIRGGYFLGDVDASQGIKNTKLPGLLIHGDKDSFVPWENVNKIESLMTAPNKKHIFKDTIHVQGPFKHPDLYWPLVADFLKSIEK
ncbi:MAG: alpha/beta hydrolase [Bacillota bacterium]|nr:alpha/beta hydrolase [Bacillota bacterium]